MTPTPESAAAGVRARWRRTVAAALLLLCGCGGVGQDGTGATPTAQTSGVINGFGSVVVSGIHFDVTNAQISLDGVAGATQSDLRVGMVVNVTGSLAADGASGTATRLDYDSLVRGTIDDAPSATALRVLGQRVTVDDTTVYSGATGTVDLRQGDALQVSGFRDIDGTLRATWIARDSGGGAPQLTGLIAAVGASNGTKVDSIQLGGLTVGIAQATLGGFGNGAPAVGQLVRAVFAAAPVGGAATATRLALIDLTPAAAVSRQQLQGIVAGWTAASGRFTLGGQAVQVDAATQFQDGALADLADGKRIEVRGTLDAARVLHAERIGFYRSALNGYARGTVTAVDVAGRSFRVIGTPGVEVRVRAQTLLDDTSVVGGVLSLANLAVGDEVLVLGEENGNRVDAWIVQRLPRLTPGSGVGGAVDAIAGTTLTVLGTTVTTGSADFFDATGAAQTSAQFFAALRTGDIVRAEGAALAGVLVARTVRRVP